MILESGPVLCGILVHWHDEARAADLIAAWDKDPQFELLVVDNGSSGGLEVGPHRLLTPQSNLGFAGAVNLALEHTRALIVLILNSDVRPEPDALRHLVDGFACHENVIGLAPRLQGPDGSPQYGWQLRPLPTLWQLLLQVLMLPGWSGPGQEPAAGTRVEQPAAAALAVKRRALIEIGGFDETFYPAWFEDVDLAARFKAAGGQILYWPAARFVHDLGVSVDRLGFGKFLWIHYRNLVIYLRKHHGSFWAMTGQILLILSSLFRLLLVPVRRPKRARSRRQAAAGLLTLAQGALTGWKLPRDYPGVGGPDSATGETP